MEWVVYDKTTKAVIAKFPEGRAGAMAAYAKADERLEWMVDYREVEEERPVVPRRQLLA